VVRRVITATLPAVVAIFHRLKFELVITLPASS
jgi:hypothetical protein